MTKNFYCPQCDDYFEHGWPTSDDRVTCPECHVTYNTDSTDDPESFTDVTPYTTSRYDPNASH